MSESEEITDELRHRLAQFLSVEKTPEGYSEKTPKGNVINYVVSKYNPSLRIEHLHVIVKIDPRTNENKSRIEGRVNCKFRAIGTEGSYEIYNNAISSVTPPGTISITKTYSETGHNLNASLRIGLSDEAIANLITAMRLSPSPRNIIIDDLMGVFYQRTDGKEPVTAFLPYWKTQPEILSDPESKDLTVVWNYTFESISLTPKGYGGLLSGIEGEKEEPVEVSVSNNLSVSVSSSHWEKYRIELQTGVEAIKTIFQRAETRQAQVLWALIVAVLILLFRSFR